MSFSATYDPHLKYRTIDTEHFAIHYPEELEDVAQRVAVISEEVHATLAPKYNWNPWGQTQMILIDSSDAANGMASVLPYNWMYIVVAAPEADSSMNTYDQWLRMLIMHEYVHILHLDKHRGFWAPFRYILGKTISPNGVTPGWIKEGLAMYEETMETRSGRGRASYTDMIIRTAVLNNEFPTIDVAAGVHWDWPGGYNRYIYGVKFMQYLADKYGEDKLYEFTELVARSPLLFMINHQARKAFSDEQFISKKVHNRYIREKKPGAPRSKSFYALWKDWKESLEVKYAAEKEKLTAERLTPFEVILRSKRTLTSPTISPDGQKIVFSESTPFGPPEIHIADISGEHRKRLKKHDLATQISFSPDGSFIVYSKIGRHKKYRYINDLYKYTFETKKVKRLTTGKRARDPDVSPDGEDVICVTQNKGTTHLEILSLAEEGLTPLPMSVPQFTQFSGPRFSPDGSKIAVAVAKPGKIWDLYIYNRKGEVVKQVTDDNAVDRDPTWSPDGKYLYFVSDRTGISNIFRYNLGTGKIEMVTNVLSGVFRPVLTPDGLTLVVQYYNGSGFDIRRVSIGDLRIVDAAEVDTSELEKKYETVSVEYKEGVPYSGLPLADTPTSAEATVYQSKKYNPFGRSLLLPRFVIPGGMILDDALLIQGITGGADPLRWHNWTGGVSYRTDANYVGYHFRYWYNRFTPVIDLGMMDYAVDFGTFRTTDGFSFRLFEKRIRGYVNIYYPVDRHVFGLGYFYEDRDAKTALDPLIKQYFNFGAFAGFTFGYGYNDSKRYEASISREGGRRIKLAFTVTNSIFGSGKRNEQYIFAGDWREYVGLWGRHVLALRAAGGMTWGDELLQGTFTLGGTLGEGALAGTGSLYYLPLRGLPRATLSGTRAMLLSVEYRMPLISAQRGLGTWPIFLNDIHLGIFADFGDAWTANKNLGDYFFDDFFLGTGAELRGNFVIGHGLPVTGRLGYGIIVLNRDRLRGLTDPLLGHDAKYGLLLLQVGASF